MDNEVTLSRAEQTIVKALASQQQQIQSEAQKQLDELNEAIQEHMTAMIKKYGLDTLLTWRFIGRPDGKIVLVSSPKEEPQKPD